MASPAPSNSHRPRSVKAPKHRVVWEKLRAQIVSGHYPPGSRLPTETEMPKLLKAGKQTVVRALNELVREGLVVRRRGDGSYVADRKRPPLIPGKHLRLGLLWHRSVLAVRIMTTFQGAITRGILNGFDLEPLQGEWSEVSEREATRVRWTSVSRGVTVDCLGEALASRERHPDIEAIRTGRFDGLLTLSIIEVPWLERLMALGIPVVLVDFPNERFASMADQVYADPLPGYRAVVRRFAEMGLKRIHFVGANMALPAPSADMDEQDVFAFRKGKSRTDPDSYLRQAAWRVGMEEHGLPTPESSVHFIAYGAEAGLAGKLLDLPEDQRPQAVLCHGIEQADALIRAFATRGVKILGAGCDGGGYEGPALPIRADGMELGHVAAELLIWKIRQPDRPVLRVGVPMGFHDARLAATMST